MGSVKLSEQLVPDQVKNYNREHYASAKDSYYSDAGKAQGQWFGELAARFGLDGGVTEEAINRLADGQHPIIGEQLVQWRKPVKEGASWVDDKSAWADYLEGQYEQAVANGTDVLTSQNPAPIAAAGKGFSPRLEPIVRSDREKLLIEIHEKAAAVYHENLLGAGGVEARAYLAERGISPESIKEFRLGLSIAHPQPAAMGLSGGKTLYSEVGHYGEELLEASGLFKRNAAGNLQERFRDRLMFPIQDGDGQTIAFAGRTLHETIHAPKYLNSPETELFHKRETLYNQHRAAEATKRAGKIQVVEGYLDVIAARQAGLRHVVANMGTALSEKQVDTLGRLASTVVLNLDSNEAAGQAATRRAVDMLLEAGLPTRIATLSGGKDAAEVVKAEGAASYRKSIAEAEGIVPWLTRYEQQGMKSDDWFFQMVIATGVRQALDAAAPALRESLAQELAAHLGVPAPEKSREPHREHRAAIDFTIAPHKSVTAAAIPGGDERIVAEHEASVRVVMKAAEEYTQARLSAYATANTRNLIAAVFTHDTARPVGGVPDPHLHTHVVVFNMTDHDGKIRAVQPLEWYGIQTFLDAVYQAEMAVRLQKLGYTLDRNTETRAAAIAGYPKEYLESISRRTSEIEDRKRELGVSGAKADQIIAHQTREAKVDWSRDQIVSYHREFARAQGVDPDAIPTAARLAPTKTVEPEGLEASITFARHTLIDRTAVFDRFQALEQSLRFGLGHIRLDQAEAALDRRKDEFVPVDHWRKHAPGERYTTPGMLQLEREVMETVAFGRESAQPLAPDITKESIRAAYSERLNNAQMRLVYDVLTCKDRIFAIQGAAGVGKTTALAIIREAIEERGYDVYGVAPTSAAASELAEAGIANAQTLQRYLSQPPPAAHDKPRVLIGDESSLASAAQMHAVLAKQLRPQDRGIFSGDIRQHQSVEAGRIFEQLQQSGMSTFHLNKIMRQKDSPELLAAVKEFSKGNVRHGLQLLDEQGRIQEYPSSTERYAAFAAQYAVSPGTTTGVAPDNETVGILNGVVRETLRIEGHVAEKGFEADILRARQDLTREALWQAWSYEPGNVVRFAKRNKTLGVRAGDYATVESIQRDANTLAVRVGKRRASLTYSPADVDGVRVYRPEHREFAVGDRVQFTQPWRAKRVDNRDFGEITQLDDFGNARIRLDKRSADQSQPRTVSANLREMPHLDYGYVVTSYAMQGASRENILIHIAAEDTRTRTMVDKIFANVAVSRAKTNCVIFCDNKEELGPTLDRLHLKPKAHSLEQIKSYTKEHTAA